jgi:hypothetical protein
MRTLEPSQYKGEKDSVIDEIIDTATIELIIVYT